MADLERKPPAQEFELSEEEIADIYKRVGVLEMRKQNLIASVSGYKEGGCVYDHYYYNLLQGMKVFLHSLKEKGWDIDIKESYEDTLQRLAKLERYNSLLEERGDLAEQELTSIPEGGYYRDLDKHAEEIQGNNYSNPPWKRK